MTKKICFLALNAYPLLSRKNLGIAGGAELQQVLLARQLVSRNYDVSFVTYDHGQNDRAIQDGVRIFKTFKRERTNQMDPVSKMTSVWSALTKANADIYLHSTGSPGVLPFYSSIRRKRFILRIPIDNIGVGKRCFQARFGEQMDIKKCSAIIAQTEFQKKNLMHVFNLRPEKISVIKNALPYIEASPQKPLPPKAIWVGSISSVKRPRIFLNLAKSLPKFKFEMFGGPTMEEPNLYDAIKSEAAHLPNLVFHGFVPYHEINKEFEASSLFINTSSVEGFPNTFLQAWAHYVPVVSLEVDPDNVLETKHIGFTCKRDFKTLVRETERLLNDEQKRKNMGYNARRHYDSEHIIQKMTDSYCRVFDSLMC